MLEMEYALAAMWVGERDVGGYGVSVMGTRHSLEPDDSRHLVRIVRLELLKTLTLCFSKRTLQFSSTILPTLRSVCGKLGMTYPVALRGGVVLR